VDLMVGRCRDSGRVMNKLDNCSANRCYMFEYDDVELVLFGKL
jgi:hypothetical protein